MIGKLKRFGARAYGTMFSPLTLAVWASGIVIAVLAGPFGTLTSMTPGQRLVFWGAVVSASVVLGYTMRAIARSVAGRGRPELCDAIAVILLSLSLTPLVWLLTRVIGTRQGDAPTFASLFIYVFAVAVAVYLVRRLTPGVEPETYRFIRRPPPPGAAPPEPRDLPPADPPPAPLPALPPDPPGPRLLRRLPPKARGPVLRLSARDHLVEVVTETAVVTLRLRLKDAIDEMEPVEGYCTHRSHWVARDAITGVERDGPQKTFVIVRNGDRVPVSRTYRPELEAAGIMPVNGSVG